MLPQIVILTKLAALEDTWNALEKAFSSSPQFFAYFSTHKVPTLKNQ